MKFSFNYLAMMQDNSYLLGKKMAKNIRQQILLIQTITDLILFTSFGQFGVVANVHSVGRPNRNYSFLSKL